MKKIFAILLSVIIILSTAACSVKTSDTPPKDEDAAENAPAQDTTDTNTEAEETPAELAEWEKPLAEQYVIEGDEAFVFGYIIQSYTDKFSVRLMDACKNYCAEAYPNCEFRDSDGEFDPSIQITAAENYIAQAVHCLIVSACDTYACGPICDMTEEAGIPLVTANSGIDCGDDACDRHNFVGSPHYSSGQLQAEYLIEYVDDTETLDICYLEGTSGFDHAVLRKAGFLETLDAAGYNYNLLASLEGAYVKENALNITEDWVVAFGEEIDVICAANDDMAIGALEALKGAAIEDVIVLGIDANEDAKSYVDKGELGCTVFQNAEAIGKWSVISAYNAALGNPTGQIDVPYELVTKDNIADYM